VHTYGGEIENLLRAGQNEWLHIPVLQNANALITVSQFTARRLNDLLPAPPPIHLVRCGVNIDEFVPNIDTQSLRRQLGLQSDEKIMLQVGRMDLHKGHERALRIFPDLLKKIPELKYIIAGSGPQEGRLKMLAKELGVEERVIFCGRVPQKELPRYYNLADVCVAPSETIPSVGQTEGFGLVLLEAAACGKPSVAGAAGGMPEAIVDGETGFLIQSGDDQALRDAIAKLLEDPALARKMGAAGRQWAQQWTWERSRQALKTILARYGEKDIRAATG
jgi:phosphatidylinositol alpha-1,6-mannosyltransferase